MSRMASFDDLKTRGRRFLARKRHSTAVRALHRFAAFIEEAYENDEWDMHVNGETHLLRRLAPAGMRTVFDVGAHVGDWTIAALESWPEAHVHAFEVAPPTFDRLRQHIASSGLAARATLNPIGLSDHAGPHEMHFYAEHPHLTCETARHPFASAPFQAAFVDGDAYMRQHGIGAIDFIKIDVEGAEHRVLNGLRAAILARRVACMQFEYGAFSVQTRVLLADYYALLSPTYWIGKVFPTHVDFREYDWTMESFRFANFLCVARDRPDLKALAAGASSAAAGRESVA